MIELHKLDVKQKDVKDLLEASQDYHSDSMKITRMSLDEMVALAKEGESDAEMREIGRSEFNQNKEKYFSDRFGLKILGGLGFASAIALAASASANAAAPTDIQILQTAASIEVLAVSTYQTALTLPFIGGSSANPVVKAFAQTTMSQHQQHQQAFNSAITKLNGKPQNNPDPALLQVVKNAEPQLTSPAAVVSLALELENGAAETYVANVSALSDLNAKKVTASIMGVEAQHVAILLAVQALLQGGAPGLIALPVNVAELPSAAGSVGFPNAFYQTNQARPETEGALS